MSISDVQAAWEAIRGLGADPLVSSVLVGLVWPLVQAALDRPWWTAARRRALVLAVAVVLSLGIWLVSAYPWAWELVATQVSVICGIAWAVHGILATVTVGGVRLVDWVGILTPGGETRQTYAARHLAVSPEWTPPPATPAHPTTCPGSRWTGVVRMPPWMTDSVLVALVGLVGVVVGHVVGGMAQYKSSQLAVMKSELDDLRARVEKLEQEKDAAVTAAREAERVQWHMVQFAREVLAWGRGLLDLLPDGLVVPPEPEPPAVVRDVL